MAPRAKAQPQAHTGGASDSEDDLNATSAATRKTNTKTTTKMPKAKAAATRRASSGRTAPKRKAAPKREALRDRTNIQDGNETEEVDAFDEDDDMAGAAKPKAKKAKTTTTRKTAKKAAEEEEEEEAPKKAPAKRGRKPKRDPSPEPVLTIPETQPDPQLEDVEPSIEMDPDTMDIEKLPTPQQARVYVQRPPSVQPLQPRPSARAGSVQPLQPRPSARAGSVQAGYAAPRSRSGSASASERRGGDPELRRQLNDITKKYENLHMKYESLQEIGKGHADSNFEKLKRASDQKAKDANDLIASLKKEIAELRKTSTSASSETTGMQKEIGTLKTSNEKITSERDDLKEKLHVSQNEVKSLEAKLMAARQQISNSAQEAKAQEAAAKKQNVPLNTNDTLKEAKMKENLYADLSGLIIANVKRNEGEDIYDCIQTGRNGTLHFHLSVGNDATTPHPKTPSGLSYEEAEFAYEPLLDESRDRELLDLLPDYLTEEICFPRNHAQRFYSKVVESMTKKIVVEED